MFYHKYQTQYYFQMICSSKFRALSKLKSNFWAFTNIKNSNLTIMTYVSLYNNLLNSCILKKIFSQKKNHWCYCVGGSGVTGPCSSLSGHQETQEDSGSGSAWTWLISLNNSQFKHNIMINWLIHPDWKLFLNMTLGPFTSFEDTNRQQRTVRKLCQ